MSRINAAEKRELIHIWEELHLHGKSAEAALTASQRLASLNAREQPGFTVELARQVVVTANAAFRKTPSLTRALPFAQKAARAINQFYPLGETAETAKNKKALWEQASYSEHVSFDHEGAEVLAHPEKSQEESTLIALRDVLHFARELENMFQDGAFAAWSQSLIQVIENLLIARPNDRFALIFLSEEAPYDEALQAYERYLELFHENPAETSSLDQFLTVSARMIARAMGEKSPAQAVTLAWHQYEQLRNFPSENQPQYALALRTNLRELAKRLRQFQNRQLAFTSFHAQYQKNPSAFPASEVRALLRKQFVAVSSKEVIPLEFPKQHR